MTFLPYVFRSHNFLRIFFNHFFLVWDVMIFLVVVYFDDHDIFAKIVKQGGKAYGFVLVGNSKDEPQGMKQRSQRKEKDVTISQKTKFSKYALLYYLVKR